MEFGEKEVNSGDKPDSNAYIPKAEQGGPAPIIHAREDTGRVEKEVVAKRKFHLPHLNFKKKTTDSSVGKEPNKFLRLIRKYWYIILLIALVVGGLIAWRSYQMHIDATWDKASDYYGRADYNKAEELIGDMPQPTDEKRLMMYAQTMLATRKLDQALPAYAALYETKKDPSVKLIIGNIYNEQKKYDEAAKAYGELIAANKGYVQAYVNLSTLNKLQGKSQEAIAVAKQGVQANPNSVVLHELLISMLLENKKSDDYKQAVATLKKINPNDPIFETIKE